MPRGRDAPHSVAPPAPPPSEDDDVVDATDRLLPLLHGGVSQAYERKDEECNGDDDAVEEADADDTSGGDADEAGRGSDVEDARDRERRRPSSGALPVAQKRAKLAEDLNIGADDDDADAEDGTGEARKKPRAPSAFTASTALARSTHAWRRVRAAREA